MAALIDEYKQAIQDVLDGRAKPAPNPSELPWTEDKAATMWAAAAAELIAEENSGGGGSAGGALVVNSDDDTGALNKTWQEIHDALSNGTVVVVSSPAGQPNGPTYLNYIIGADKGAEVYNIYFSYDYENPAMTATSADGYPEWA